MPPSRNIVSAQKKQKSGRETRFGGVPYSETGLQHIIYIGKHHFGHFGRFQKKLGSDFLFHLPVTRQVDSENSGTTCRARVSRRSYPAPDPGPSTWTCFPGTPPPSSFHEIAPRTRSRTWTSFPGPPSHIISFKVQGTGGESEGGSKISFVFY